MRERLMLIPTNDDISMRVLELQTEQGNRVAAGTVKRSAHRLTTNDDISMRVSTNDDISMRVLELQTEQGNRVAAGTVKRLVGERNHRIEEWQIRWDEIRDALDDPRRARRYPDPNSIKPST